LYTHTHTHTQSHTYDWTRINGHRFQSKVIWIGMSITASIGRRKRHRRRLWQLAAAEFFIICFASCSVCFLLLAVYLCQKTTQLHSHHHRSTCHRTCGSSSGDGAPFIRAPMDFSYIILFYFLYKTNWRNKSGIKMKNKREKRVLRHDRHDASQNLLKMAVWRRHPHDQYIRLVFKRRESTHSHESHETKFSISYYCGLCIKALVFCCCQQQQQQQQRSVDRSIDPSASYSRAHVRGPNKSGTRRQLRAISKVLLRHKQFLNTLSYTAGSHEAGGGRMASFI